MSPVTLGGRVPAGARRADNSELDVHAPRAGLHGPDGKELGLSRSSGNGRASTRCQRPPLAGLQVIQRSLTSGPVIEEASSPARRQVLDMNQSSGTICYSVVNATLMRRQRFHPDPHGSVDLLRCAHDGFLSRF